MVRVAIMGAWIGREGRDHLRFMLRLCWRDKVNGRLVQSYGGFDWCLKHRYLYTFVYHVVFIYEYIGLVIKLWQLFFPHI